MQALLLSTSNLLTESAKTVFIGLLVVFAVLLALTLIFRLFGVAASVGKHEKFTAEAEVSSELIAAIAGIVAAESDEVSDEVAAVIAAAVYAMSDEKTRYKIHRITPVGKSTRPVWAAAGIAQNTTPF